jgi:hypothetical protein
MVLPLIPKLRIDDPRCYGTLRRDRRLPLIAVIDAEILLTDARAGIPFTLITMALAGGCLGGPGVMPL